MKKQVVEYDYENDFIKNHNLEYRQGPYIEGKWLWPKEDTLCWKFFNDHEKKEWEHLGINYHFPHEILKLLTDSKKRIAIQAGGNCGLYAKLYSKVFEKVITFEPDHRWFICLTHNADEKNIFKFQTALGNDNIPVSLIAPDFNGKENLGAIYIQDNGIIPKIKIDSLGIDPDLIHLDIEGSEWEALLGAQDTIQRSKPLIVVEWNQSGKKYGWTDEKIEELFKSFDYILYKEWSRDRAYIHKDKL